MRTLILAVLLLVSTTTVVFAMGSNSTDYNACVKSYWPQCSQYSSTPQFDVCLKPYTTQCQCKYWDKAWLKKYGVNCT